MAIFRRKEKEQLITPPTSAEQTRVVEPGQPVEISEVPKTKAAEQQPFEQTAATQETTPTVSGGQTAMPTPAVPMPQPKSQVRVEVEAVLSEGLVKVYQAMTPAEQEKFRVAGEEAATRIEQLMDGFRATARSVLEIIRRWLSLIPHVNKYFLEQESKIKTDRMIALQRKLKHEYHAKHIRME